MANRDKETKKFLTGAVIGSVLGICVASMYAASKKASTQNRSLDALGKAIIHMGEILKGSDTTDTPLIHNLGKSIHKHEETISDVVEILSSGIHLWQKFRKG